MIDVVEETLDIQVVTQSNCQHRCRACPTASSADFPGR
jgi:hypothetical protein